MIKELTLDIGINGLKEGRSFWLTLCMLGNFACFFCRLLFFFKIKVFKKNFRIKIRVSNSLTPDQA